MPVTTDGEGLVFPQTASQGEQNRRLSASVSYEQEMWTFQDAVEHLLDGLEVNRSGRARRMAKRAVLYAHRNFPSLHKWPYYQRLHVINTVAPYSTGTIAFDYTEGTYERLVTLTGGTFPTWTAFGFLRIANVDYPVLQRISDTQCTLSNSRSPAGDVAAGATYSLYRSQYPLPLDFRRGDRIIDQSTGRELISVNASFTTAQQLHYRGNTTPFIASVAEDENYLGGIQLQVNAPSSASQYSFLYERQPRPLNTELYDTGTLTIEEDNAQITGVGTAFTSQMIGSVLRVSANASVPTSRVGSLADDQDNPATYTRIIMAVIDETIIAVDETLGEDASDRAFTISDPIDVHVQSMLDGFLRCSEWEFARLIGRDDVVQRMATFYQQLDVCRDAVRHSTVIQGANPLDGDYGYSLLGNVNVRPDL